MLICYNDRSIKVNPDRIFFCRHFPQGGGKMRKETAEVIEKMIKKQSASNIKEVQKSLKEETGILLKDISSKKKD